MLLLLVYYAAATLEFYTLGVRRAKPIVIELWSTKRSAFYQDQTDHTPESQDAAANTKCG